MLTLFGFFFNSSINTNFRKVGRRVLMLIGSLGMAITMGILAGTNYMSQNKIGGSPPGIVSVICLFSFNTFFSLGWLGMTWLYPAEIVPLRIRARANGLSTSANWITNFMVVMITPVAFSSIGYQTYIIFAVLNICIIPVVYIFYPETAYRSLEESKSFHHPLFTSSTNIIQLMISSARPTAGSASSQPQSTSPSATARTVNCLSITTALRRRPVYRKVLKATGLCSAGTTHLRRLPFERLWVGAKYRKRWMSLRAVGYTPSVMLSIPSRKVRKAWKGNGSLSRAFKPRSMDACCL